MLCPEVAAKQAATAGHSPADELHLLTVHGVLHLLGYDHAEPEEEREMFGLQARLLAELAGDRHRVMPTCRSQPARPLACPTCSCSLVAAGLVVLAGLFAMTDAALAAVSPARAARAGPRGRARRPRAAGRRRPTPVRHINLLLLLRLLCELTATTLVALVAVDSFGAGWPAALVTAGAMTVVSFVVVGVAPAHHRPPARLRGGPGRRAAGALAGPGARPAGRRC